MVPPSLSFKRHLARGRASSSMLAMPLIAAGPDEIGPSDLSNQMVWFFCFEQELPAPYSIHVSAHFGDSAGNQLLQA
jgi:hypothetical protein